MHLDSLQEIAIFVNVAETGSFTKAARRLGITPSGVSKSLRRLEEKLKVRLVSRTTRSVHLTDEGRVLAEQYRQIITEVEEAEALLNRRLARPSGRVRLQVPVGLGRRIVVPLMVTFTRELPEISIDVEMSDRNADPAEEGIDASIRIGEPSDSRLVARKLGDIPFLLVASPQYVREYGAPSTPNDLVHHQCLSYYVPQSGRYREWDFRLGNEQTFVKSFPGRLNVNNAQALMQAAISGAGIALISSFMASDAIKLGELQVLLKDYRSFGPPAWLIYGERRFQLPRVRALIEYLVENVPKALEQHNFHSKIRAPTVTFSCPIISSSLSLSPKRVPSIVRN